MADYISKYKTQMAVGIVWLFHISAIIGILIGNQEWFIAKTPLNLSICLLLFLIIYPINTLKKGIVFCIFYVGGMLAEWLGVQYGILFGEYSYGINFGPKLDGVPYLIGAYWSLLTFITAGILDYFDLKIWLKVFLSASLMVTLDFFMEHSAPIFNFWEFNGGVAPLENYGTWFIIALLFQVILRILKIEGNKMYGTHLYFAQILFFLVFFL
ncbi:carotenoid biosynthesis protein [Maribacter sp. 2210JD10-5]|uniref:carotenoid biosynthesis protein n=1 Tax=Maribacter sp. 2210JD10-5 TaxID=3386272 RepID=UPI0039BCE9E3